MALSSYDQNVPGKPYQSKLSPYEEELYALLKRGMSYRRIAETLNERHGLGVSHNAVFSYVKAASRKRRLRSRFDDGLDADLREGLMKQIVAVWTHDSTAIEGNTLTLDETSQVLELGLTISGKPLKDHQEVYGHARAIDLIRRFDSEPELDEAALFDLHRAVMHDGAVDAMNPIGEWKRDYNGVTGVVRGKMKYFEYSPLADVPALMRAWLKEFNTLRNRDLSKDEAIDAYAWAHLAFVRIHPFFDGNGRMARLLANLPVLGAGWPPILLSVENRARYIEILWRYQWAVGQLRAGKPLLPKHRAVGEFRKFVQGEWSRSIEIVEEARAMQARRGYFAPVCETSRLSF